MSQEDFVIKIKFALKLESFYISISFLFFLFYHFVLWCLVLEVLPPPPKRPCMTPIFNFSIKLKFAPQKRQYKILSFKILVSDAIPSR